MFTAAYNIVGAVIVQFASNSFLISGTNTYTVEVTVHESPYFYISKNWESKIYEGMATFKINGRKAWGITEWQYRNIQGKEVEEAKEKLHLFN